MPINSDFRGRVAEGAVGALLIIKAGAGSMSCVLAAAATDKLLGTSDELDHAIGEMVDQAVGPVPKVRLGGTVAARRCADQQRRRQGHRDDHDRQSNHRLR